MPNRYCRDELIAIALNMVLLPNLEVHDMPDGIVMPDAFCIRWLQDILDFWYHLCPFSATVNKVSLNCTANNDKVILPADFIIDVRNGYLVQTKVGDVSSMRRILRVPLQKFINRQISSQSIGGTILHPYVYSVVGDDGVDVTQYQTMLITPTPTINTIGQLWYYKLPPVLSAYTKPKFPDDYACIEYLRIRALEWAHIYEPGTAHKFCNKIVADMKSAGLMNEPEDDEIPMDELTFTKGNVYTNSYSWMGPR